MANGGRDFVGYGPNPIDPKWPGGARIAVNFAVAYEGGAESNILDGDSASESFLNDIGSPAVAHHRNPLVESVFEYGARVGVWRLLRIFRQFGLKVDLFATASALARNPEVARRFREEGHEIVAHHYRWIDYIHVDPLTERDHIRKAVQTIEEITGERPRGWMSGRPSMNTRRLLVEEGGFLYDRDALNDEIPYWSQVDGQPHLVIPFSYETSDSRTNQSFGWAHGDDLFHYLKDAFDLLYQEGEDTPRMLSIGVHDRFCGRPARAAGLIKFLDYLSKFDKVWVCQGHQIAEHWQTVHPPSAVLQQS